MNVDSGSSQTSRRRVAVLAALAALALLLVAVTPAPFTPGSVLAAVVLVASFALAAYLPRRLSRVAGRTGAMAFTMVLLGAVGLGIGGLTIECATWSSACRRELGGWLVAWMTLAPAFALVVLLARGMRTVVALPVRAAVAVMARLRLRRRPR